MIKSLNLDEILYRIHIYFMDPLWGVISFRWLRESSSARYLENKNEIGTYSDAGFWDSVFSSSLFRILESRPSNKVNSVEEKLNPSEERGWFETLIDIMFGRDDKQSVIELLFTTPLGLLFVGAVAAGVIYALVNRRIDFQAKKEEIMYNIASKTNSEEPQVAPVNDKVERWAAITKKIEGESQDLWKIAVMDADILLDDVLREKGYLEGTVADKLKSASAQYPDVIQNAWDGHKIRNNIAHDATFELTKRGAQQAIKSYELFFQALY